MVRPALVLSFVILAACASSSGTQGPARQRNLITAAEIATVQTGSAYDVVQSLRPEFLRARGTSAGTGVQEFAVVYVDGVRAGDPNELRRVPREVLQEIRYLSGNDATTMYGTGHGGGAILVVTKR
jgi:hypothetical protein